ncbi:hypothetical protein HDV00_007602 [Rhizophlyctis rosea]|nr:hypothetical protein HDV00_007602 [Rhizophlyctis rosea]
MTDTPIRDQEMRNIFRKLHTSYLALVSNPFWDPDSTKLISSKRFLRSLQEVVAGRTGEVRGSVEGR